MRKLESILGVTSFPTTSKRCFRQISHDRMIHLHMGAKIAYAALVMKAPLTWRGCSEGKGSFRECWEVEAM